MKRSARRSAEAYFAGEPLVLAHRGASAYAPDHTLTAFRLAIEQGADAIEVDVHVTKDGVPVLHHAGDLSENTEGRGPVAKLTHEEIRAFDAGYRYSPDGISHPFRGKGERIPTLGEALTGFPDARFNIDIKDRRAARLVRRVVDEHDASGRVLIASWYSWRRAPARAGYPGPVSVTLDEMLAFMVLFWSRLDGLWTPDVDAFQVPERYLGVRVLSRRLVERAHRSGLRVHVWTVDAEPDMERLWDWGVDGIVTNRPDMAVRTRRRYLSGSSA